MIIAHRKATLNMPTDLTTPRFSLRPFAESDVEQFSFIDDASFRKYLFDGFPDRSDYVANNLATDWSEELNYVIDAAGRVVGSVHLGLGAPTHVGELACLIAPDRWNAGVAPEACSGVLDHAFAHTQLNKAIARCDEHNRASQRVLQKLGMTREGVLRKQRPSHDGQMVDELYYGLFKDEWLRRSSALAPVHQLRALTQADIPQCVAVLRELPQWFGIEDAILDYAKDLETLDGYVAALAGEVVGFVGLKRYGDQSVEINVIGVRPAHRGRGLGTSLLQHVEAHATTAETQLLHMKTLAPSHSDPNYAQTRAFWEARGFLPMDAHLLWGPENPCQVMVKPLIQRH
jgi:RimJ/RimL family protein N-acetyltransferase